MPACAVLVVFRNAACRQRRLFDVGAANRRLVRAVAAEKAIVLQAHPVSTFQFRYEPEGTAG